jgi:hypothetical protein
VHHERVERFRVASHPTRDPIGWHGGAAVRLGVEGGSMPSPKTSYAKSGDVNVAYQVLGDGPLDLVYVWGWISHLDFQWMDPT